MTTKRFYTEEQFITIFEDINYLLFDQVLWEYSDDFITRYDVDIIYIGLNFFKTKKNCPLLLNLNRLGKEEKIEMYDYICTSSIDIDNSLDRMKISQNLFKCNDFDTLKKFLEKILVIGKINNKKLLRFYDPRVSFFSNHIMLTNKLKHHKKLFLEFFENNTWYINIYDAYWKLNDNDYELESYMSNDEIEDLQKKIRSKNDLNYLNINNFIESYSRG